MTRERERKSKRRGEGSNARKRERVNEEAGRWKGMTRRKPMKRIRRMGAEDQEEEEEHDGGAALVWAKRGGWAQLNQLSQVVLVLAQVVAIPLIVLRSSKSPHNNTTQHVNM
jgi:hypothetical protein